MNAFAYFFRSKRKINISPTCRPPHFRDCRNTCAYHQLPLGYWKLLHRFLVDPLLFPIHTRLHQVPHVRGLAWSSLRHNGKGLKWKTDPTLIHHSSEGQGLEGLQCFLWTIRDLGPRTLEVYLFQTASSCGYSSYMYNWRDPNVWKGVNFETGESTMSHQTRIPTEMIAGQFGRFFPGLPGPRNDPQNWPKLTDILVESSTQWIWVTCQQVFLNLLDTFLQLYI